jgi:hypothetical protein
MVKEFVSRFSLRMWRVESTLRTCFAVRYSGPFPKRNEFVVKDKKQKLLVYFHEQPCKPLQGNRFLFPVDVYEEAQDLDCYVKEGRSSLSE